MHVRRGPSEVLVKARNSGGGVSPGPGRRRGSAPGRRWPDAPLALRAGRWAALGVFFQSPPLKWSERVGAQALQLDISDAARLSG